MRMHCMGNVCCHCLVNSQPRGLRKRKEELSFKTKSPSVNGFRSPSAPPLSTAHYPLQTPHIHPKRPPLSQEPCHERPGDRKKLPISPVGEKFPIKTITRWPQTALRRVKGPTAGTRAGLHGLSLMGHQQDILPPGWPVLFTQCSKTPSRL